MSTSNVMFSGQTEDGSLDLTGQVGLHQGSKSLSHLPTADQAVLTEAFWSKRFNMRKSALVFKYKLTLDRTPKLQIAFCL